MDRTALIVRALIAGNAAASSPGAPREVHSALGTLKGLLRSRLTGIRTEFTLHRYEEDPAQWRHALTDLVAETELDRDTEIVDAAQRVMRLVDPTGTAKGTYVVEKA